MIKKAYGIIRMWGDYIMMTGIVLVVLAIKYDNALYGLLGGILFARGLDWYVENKIEASKGDSVDE